MRMPFGMLAEVGRDEGISGCVFRADDGGCFAEDDLAHALKGEQRLRSEVFVKVSEGGFL